MKNKPVLRVMLAIFLALSTPLFADTYETKSGKIYEGTMIDEDDANIYLDVPSGGSVNLKKADILNQNGKPYQADGKGVAPANAAAEKHDLVFLDPSPEEKKGDEGEAEFTEEELKTYFDAHPEEFRVPEQVFLKMINSKTLTGKPEEILNNPTASHDWVDSGWREKRPDAFNIAFSDEEINRIFGLQKGQTLSITDRTGATFLFWATDRKEASALPFAEAKEKIQGELRLQKRASA